MRAGSTGRLAASMRWRPRAPSPRTPATRHLGVDVVVFCDEEGHFGSFLGSRSFIGVLEESEIDEATEPHDGTPMREALQDRRLGRAARAI